MTINDDTYCSREFPTLPFGLIPSHTLYPAIRIMKYLRMILNVALYPFNDFLNTMSVMLPSVTKIPALP